MHRVSHLIKLFDDADTLATAVESNTYVHMSCKHYLPAPQRSCGDAPLRTYGSKVNLRRLVLRLSTCKLARAYPNSILPLLDRRLILLTHSPAVVGNLWDVTDKDLDRYTHSTLDKFGLFGERGKVMSLPRAIAASRSACSLRYLNGAAPVVWGIPVTLTDRDASAPP